MTIKPRRPKDDVLDADNGYQESDFDYVMNNLDLAVKLLDQEAAIARAPSRAGGSTLARILREIRRKANYEKAGFSDFEIPGKVSMHFPFNMPFTTDELTDAIRETTRLYRDSWVNPLIDGLIAWTEGKADIQQIEKNLL